MTDEHTQSLKASVGENKWIQISGPSAFLTALILVLLGVVGWLVNFNLKSWGEPISITEAFTGQARLIKEHTAKMSGQHGDLTLAVQWNTWVQWVCSPMNVNASARRECSEAHPLKPEPEEPIKRRYLIPQE